MKGQTVRRLHAHTRGEECADSAAIDASGEKNHFAILKELNYAEWN
jgi:hypothetical protein